MAIKIQIRRGLASEWASANPILALGEQGFETDTKKIKIGDGITAYNSLPYFNKNASELDAQYEPKNANIQSHISSTSNPHSVTKAQVGLENVDNTSDADKPISSATQSALDLKYDASNPSSYITASQAPVQSVNSQTGIVVLGKSDVGLNNVDNTSDADKPISTATQSALDLKANSATTYTKTQVDSLNASTLSSANTYTDNKVAQVVNSAPATLDTLNELAAALGNDPNFATTTATLIGTKANSADVYSKTASDANYEPKNVNIQNHISNISNPHAVTKAQIGLGDVDNVSAANLRDRSTHTGTQLAATISDFTTAVQGVQIGASKIGNGQVSNSEFATLDGIITGVSIQSQIDGKQATITGAATSVTSSDLTASKVVVSDSLGKIAASSVSSTTLGYLDATSSVQTQLNGKEPSITAGTTSQYFRGDKSFQTLDKTAVGLSNVDNISAANLRDRSTHTGTQLASTISDFTTAVQAVTIDASKIDGGNVSNLEFSYLDGVTSAIQTQLDGKEPSITTLSIAKGGTNSSTALNNNRIMRSSGGAIIEAAAITASRALISDANGIPTQSATTSTELGYVSGVTSAIQTQIDGKQATGNYITALTGDVTASGPGSAAATLANSGITAGTYDVVTVDAKGRATSGSVTRWAYRTTTTQVSTTASYAAVTELTSVSLPVGLYKISFFGIAQTAATTTGIGFRVGAGTATISTINAKFRIGQAADGVNKDFVYDQLAANTNVTSASVVTANANFNSTGEGVIRVTVAGTIRMEFRTEVAASAATLQADSIFVIESIA